ncbi:hypothetical protein pb186bvf_018354 [Paramecium bursaria]
MGAACHGRKEIKQQMPDKQISPVKEKQSQEIASPEKITQMVKIQKKFSGLLDLIGNVDMLSTPIKDKVQELQSKRRNLEVIVTNQVRRALQSKGIVRAVQDSDIELVLDDVKFQKQLQTHLKKIQSILQPLCQDEEFTNTFPIQSVSYQELADLIALI